MQAIQYGLKIISHQAPMGYLGKNFYRSKQLK